MKTQIKLLSTCLLLASVLIVPQLAHAVCAPLTGAYGYGLAGSTLNFAVAAQTGVLNFTGAGSFTNTFSNTTFNPNTANLAPVRDDVTQGTYTFNSDCKTGTMVFHGNYESFICVHFAFSLTPGSVPLGSLVYGKGLPKLTLDPLPTVATLTCTDPQAQLTIAPGVTIPTYTGTMAPLL